MKCWCTERVGDDERIGELKRKQRVHEKREARLPLVLVKKRHLGRVTANGNEKGACPVGSKKYGLKDEAVNPKAACEETVPGGTVGRTRLVQL